MLASATNQAQQWLLLLSRNPRILGLQLFVFGFVVVKGLVCALFDLLTLTVLDYAGLYLLNVLVEVSVEITVALGGVTLVDLLLLFVEQLLNKLSLSFS